MAVGLALVAATGCATPQPQPQPQPTPQPQAQTAPAPAAVPLSADDVSWLFPPPKSDADLATLIAVKDVTIPDPANPGGRLPIWTDSDFNDFLRIADSSAAQVAGGARIGLPAAARSKAVWFIAGVRIDAGAPGLDPKIIAVFGQRPQIRLILQPVLPGPDGKPQVQDIAAHLIFDFAASSPTQACPLHATADLAAFGEVVTDAAALRDQLAAGQVGATRISTAGLPLGVHPGLADPATAPALAAQMKTLLQNHLAPQRLNTMAMMGLPSGQIAPWIFLSMLRSQTGHFEAVRGPTLDGTQFAMMLTPAGQKPRVAPEPRTNNLAPITCANGLFGPQSLPLATRHGSATADIFAAAAPDQATVQAVTDLVADPTRSHFFNTDCVSCHTETRIAMGAPINMTSAPGLSPSVMPNSGYNVRNFGWSPPSAGPARGTATRRSANETAAVVAWLNANMPRP